jgi:hypothetical protein
MTQKKLRLVGAKLFSACPVRRGSWYLEEGCLARQAPHRLARLGHLCGQRPRRAVRRSFDHARRIER